MSPPPVQWPGRRGAGLPKAGLPMMLLRPGSAPLLVGDRGAAGERANPPWREALAPELGRLHPARWCCGAMRFASGSTRMLPEQGLGPEAYSEPVSQPGGVRRRCRRSARMIGGGGRPCGDRRCQLRRSGHPSTAMPWRRAVPRPLLGLWLEAPVGGAGGAGCSPRAPATPRMPMSPMLCRAFRQPARGGGGALAGDATRPTRRRLADVRRACPRSRRNMA